MSGKIAGQYRAKGYSKSHAQRIGNSVVGKMGSTFKPGKGSKKSYAAGAVTGYYMVRGGRGNPTRAGNLGARRKRARGKRSDVGAHAARVSDYGTGKAAAPCAGMGRESEGKYPKAYGKAYAKDYSKRYK